MLRRIGLCVVLATAALIAREARADVNSGRTFGANVTGTFFRTILTQGATETWTITTTGLSPGSDTVLHVQNAADFTFIAGDDDYGGTLASQVVVPPVGYFRELFVIVRSYSAGSQGTCTVAVSSSVSGLTNLPATFGGAEYYVGDLVSGAYATTVERQGGAADTIMLTVGGPSYNPSHAVAYDDDNGTGYMSSVHDAEACQGCVIVLANWNSLETGTYTADLVWDGDRDSTDWDGDGLGASLEHVIGTGDSTADTDQDGLGDGAELLGVEVNYAPVKLPTWGADPLQKDLFWEMDWKKCNSQTPGVCPQGFDSGQMGAGLPDADFQAQKIEPTKALLGTGIRVHFDMGRANTNPATWSEWGAWGGATRLEVPVPPAPDPFDACGTNGSSPERAYMFHYGLGIAPDNVKLGNACGVPGPSFNSLANDYYEIVHETGHGLGLEHGGRAWAGAINFKPNYISLMNYNYSGAGFSHGDFPSDGRVLNPVAVKENPGLGSTATTAVLTTLRDTWCPVTNYSTGKCVNIDGNAGVPGLPIGAVDWNRDGVYEAQGVTVQGAVNEQFFSRSARTTFALPSSNGFGVLADPALTWVSVGGTVGDQLWIFGRDDSNRLVWARTPRTTLDAGCSAFTSFYDESTWNCAQFGNASGINGVTTLVPGPEVLAVAPGAAQYNAQILVVFQGTTGTMKSKLISINNSTGNILYGNDVIILQSQGGIVATGDITALSTAAGVVSVWVPTGTGASARLTELRYQNGAWTNQGNGLWTDGTIVVPMYGIGATRGYQDGSSTASTYAAIPVYPNGLVEFVVKSNASPFRWSKVTLTCTPGSFGCVGGVASSWAGTGGVGLPPNGTQPMARARPGIAYQRKAGQPNNFVGRFYMGINQGSSCSGPFGTPQTWMSPPCGALIIMTEGNLSTGTPPPASRRLTWITPAQWIYSPETANAVVKGISLVDDLTRDKNLRAAFDVFGGPNYGVFEPLADGIINVNLSDFDDYAYLTGGMRASLCLEGGVWPGAPPNPCLLTSLP